MSLSFVDGVVPGGRGARPRRILIVEDDFLSAMAAEAALVAAGFDVVGIAVDGPRALAAAEAAAPDLVLTDIKLRGDMEGLAIAAEMRRRFDLPCLFISGNLDRATRLQAAPLRPAGFLDKPYTERQLLAVVHAAFAGGEAARERDRAEPVTASA